MKNLSRRGNQAFLLLALLVLVPPIPAQQAEPGKAADANAKTATNRVAYFLHHGNAAELAKVLAAHFKDAAEIQALPESAGNCLLIKGTGPVTEEVLKLLTQLDRRPQMMAIEILVGEMPAKKELLAKEGAPKPERPTKELELNQFTGPAADVVANLQALCDQGRIDTLRRVRLTLVEGLPGTAALTENKPMVVGITVTATGVASRNVAYRPVGLQAKATARVTADQKIEINLEASDARMEPSATVILAKDENGAPVMAMDLVNARFSGKLVLSPGGAAAADGVTVKSKSEGGRTLIVVTAKLIDPDAKPEPEESPLNRPTRPARQRRPREQPPPPPNPPTGGANPM
jgi:hypothetical protein